MKNNGREPKRKMMMMMAATMTRKVKTTTREKMMMERPRKTAWTPMKIKIHLRETLPKKMEIPKIKILNRTMRKKK